MAALEVLSLDTATPQIRAPGAADTYTFPRQALFLDGTVGVPGIAQTSDDNTGMWWPAADTLAWSVGGVEGLRLTSTGNLLVGRTAALGGGANRELLVNTASAGQIAGLNLAVNGTLSGVFHSTTSYSYAGTKTNAPFLLFANDGERCRLPAEGGFVVGTAALATGASNGFLWVPSCAGTPTGTPTTFTGRVPIVVDTTNNKLYFYSGGSWRDAGP